MSAARSLLDEYHEISKHGMHRGAPGPDGLDWANQPNPYRHFGSERIVLPVPQDSDIPNLPYNDLFRAASVRGVGAADLSLASVSSLLFHSMALSAMKKSGHHKWFLRVNPSSGNLHPTEAYVVANFDFAAGPAVYHYSPEHHVLEYRALLTAEQFAALTAGLPGGSLLVALTSIPWRESWKYGVRAFRYCQHDTGHAIAAVALGASLLGWQARMWPVLDTSSLAALLAVNQDDHDESEHAETLMAIVPSAAAVSVAREAVDVEAACIAAAAPRAALGEPNRLSADHRVWPLIEATFDATAVQRSALQVPSFAASTAADLVPSFYHTREPAPTAATIIRQRRSAVDMDRVTPISAAQFFSMLGRVVPAIAPGPPWDVMPVDNADWGVDVHLLLFVHRVKDVKPGLYVLARDASQVDELKRVLRPDFAWRHPHAAPATLPLYRLEFGNATEVARDLSCTQEIAADGVFSVAMIARYSATAERPHQYRKLFWETGMIGQVLYLEAEAQGIRATGIGCYVDDPTHSQFFADPTDHAFQDLYHFTVGGPVEDPRLQTLNPYGDR